MLVPLSVAPRVLVLELPSVVPPVPLGPLEPLGPVPREALERASQLGAPAEPAASPAGLPQALGEAEAEAEAPAASE